MPLNFAIVTTGLVPRDVSKTFGGTARWLSSALKRTEPFQQGNARLQIYDATRGRFPDPKKVDGLVISGNFSADASLASPADVAGRAASMAQRPGWIHALDSYLLEQTGQGTPTLGVCFGHQKVVDLFGGRVVENPKGFELGTATIAKGGEDDWFLRGIPQEFKAQQFHSDIGVEVDKIPGGRILAGNDNTAAQVVAIDDGPRDVRSVQFHPEARKNIAQALVDHIGGPAMPVTRSPEGQTFVDNFANHVAEKARAE